MLVGMSENNSLLSDVRGTDDVAQRSSNGIVLISVAEVMLGTAASAGARPRGALRGRWARLCAARAARRRIARRRPDYLENAAMAREMHRL
jgi:hypothetical protein